MDSLLNEMKLDFKRGQKIKYFDHIGKIHIGTYIMAGSKENTIVLDSGCGNGTGFAVVVPIEKIWNMK